MARERREERIALRRYATYNGLHDTLGSWIAGRPGMSFSAFILIAVLASQNPVLTTVGPIRPEVRRQFYQASLRATAHRSRGEYAAAAAVLEQALVISRDNGLSHQFRQCLLRIAILKWDLGSISDSMSRFMEALTAFIHAGDSRSVEFCGKCISLIRLYEEGKQNREMKFCHRSLARLEDASSIGKDIGILDFELKCLRQKGLAYWEMGRIDLFLECSKQGLKISDRLNHHVEKGRCLNNMGISYHKLNEYSLALEYLASALSTVRKSGDRPTEAECLSNLGLLYRDLGNYPRAQFCLTEALAIDREVDDPRSIASDLANLGTVLLRSGIDNKNKQELSRGLDAFLEICSLQRKDETIGSIRITTLNNIGVIYNELGDFADSRRFLYQALQAIDQGKHVLERGCILNNLAASYLYENNLAEALRFYLMSNDLGIQHSLENVVIESCYGLGKCFELSQRYAEALAFYQLSISSMEKVRERLTSEITMIGFFRNKLAPYHSIISLLVVQYQEQPSIELLEQIFNFMERARARAFLNNIQNPENDLADQEVLLFKERLARLEENISDLSAKLRNSKIKNLERSLLQNEMEHEEEDYHQLVSDLGPRVRVGRELEQDKVCSIRQIQRLLMGSETALFEYFLAEERSYLVLITSQTAELFVLAGKAEIESSMRGFLKMISEASIDSKAGFIAAERISRELAPFNWEETLGGLRSIVVIPDGILHSLPFETVRIREGGESRYLIEKWALSYCPSASSFSALARLPEDRVWQKELLAIGGPVYGIDFPFVLNSGLVPRASSKSINQRHRTDLTPLPNSREEITEITKLFSKDKVQVLIGSAANEDAVKALPLKDFRIIHFACHGLLDDRYPLRSALALSQSPDQKGDGLLQMREIYGLKTNADLVVLSACQTARGFIENAEGPMGLARAFFFSGARAVLATLWPISDKAAVLLMREFYRNYLRGDHPGEALRLAKIKMIGTSWSHPYYWAAVTLQGNPRSGSAVVKSN